MGSGYPEARAGTNGLAALRSDAPSADSKSRSPAAAVRPEESPPAATPPGLRRSGQQRGASSVCDRVLRHVPPADQHTRFDHRFRDEEHTCGPEPTGRVTRRGGLVHRHDDPPHAEQARANEVGVVRGGRVSRTHPARQPGRVGHRARTTGRPGTSASRGAIVTQPAIDSTSVSLRDATPRKQTRGASPGFTATITTSTSATAHPGSARHGPSETPVQARRRSESTSATERRPGPAAVEQAPRARNHLRRRSGHARHREG